MLREMDVMDRDVWRPQRGVEGFRVIRRGGASTLRCYLSLHKALFIYSTRCRPRYRRADSILGRYFLNASRSTGHFGVFQVEQRGRPAQRAQAERA
jgi:hypothetical protein